MAQVNGKFKVLVGLIVACLIIVMTSSNYSVAKASSPMNTYEFDALKYIALFDELTEAGIDMVNLSNNKHLIDELSIDAKDFYLAYENEMMNGLTPEELQEVQEIINSENLIMPMMDVDVGSGSGGVIKDADGTIFVSHDLISKLNKITGFSGGVAGVFAVLIKMKWGATPKEVLILAGAVVALGVGTINACNWNDRGIYITVTFVGSMTAPVPYASCRAA